MRRAFTVACAVMLATGSGLAAQTATSVPGPEGWVIGPIIRGQNYSEGMPLHPSRSPRGMEINLPQAPGSAHYITFSHGSLEGKRRIVLRYRLETAPGVRVLAKTDPNAPGIITPYFQRRGDNWSARGRFESYRWYGSFATQTLKPGEHEIVAPLDARWTAVMTSNAFGNREGFRAAIRETDQVGFVLGGGDGYGHGVFATGPARLTVTDFRVE